MRVNLLLRDPCLEGSEPRGSNERPRKNIMLYFSSVMKLIIKLLKHEFLSSSTNVGKTCIELYWNKYAF